LTVAETNYTEFGVLNLAGAKELLTYVQDALQLTEPQSRKLQTRLWRFSAHVRQPRKNDGKCNRTPFFDRWDVNTRTSHLTVTDPRYASAEECGRVYITLLALLLEAKGIPELPLQALALIEQTLGRSFQPGSLACVHTERPISANDIKRMLNYTTSGLGNYEISTSYRTGLQTGGRHERSNVGWMKPLHINYKLRNTLRAHLAQLGASNRTVKNALEKIQVKSYCTDKRTMPPHFSNRDVRWATWSDSDQYASHYQCARIELELMAQLYEFTGAPLLDEQLAMDVMETRGQPISPGTRRCFVTGRHLHYQDYVQAAIDPQGGRSAYHVGHVLPLTRGGKHSWENIAWTSEDGNRIQGNDTLEEIEVKLVDVVEYHLRRDMVMDNPPQIFYDKVEKLWALLSEIRQARD
jgi:hypothetical protein